MFNEYHIKLSGLSGALKVCWDGQMIEALGAHALRYRWLLEVELPRLGWQRCVWIETNHLEQRCGQTKFYQGVVS
ncbi:hypothetical protein F2Q69_00026358 [Brassica cretica]|uniref:Uncharacterized protein n=1 Tax=Brassica cretica TaxID=69181 RepID=A0A8S9RSP9_BRACR|nr:hypothetical protein F2Q69_00026358 [Brassica cretica]